MTSIVRIVILSAFVLASCSKFAEEPGTVKNPLKEGTRQIHLDFHTSEALDSVGFAFDKKQFQEALLAGKVNSINIFGKGHHSWCYYPSKAGKMHPGLNFDLLGAQIEACHEVGIRAQVYFTIGWSANDAIEHPEWAIVNKDGTNEYRKKIESLKPGDPFGWGWELLSPEGAYLDLILAQTEEIVKNYEIDGMWFDIVPFTAVNYSDISRKDLKERGIDISDESAIIERHIEKMELFCQKTNELVKSYRPDASIYYNWSTHATGDRLETLLKHKYYQFNTKHDLEDLPTSWAGYDIFPWRAKYFANTGKEIVAMSGKFHKSWGEFGGFKHKDAILYEAASMVAFGANANFGDQLHPSGIMEMATYKNIGYAYDYVAKIEDYGVGAIHKASTGLYIGDDNTAVEGTVRMLLENQVNFNVVNTLDDWSDIETLVITSGGIHQESLSKILSFIERGGKVLIIGDGIFVDGEPIIDIGAEYLGKPKYDVDYTLVKDQLSGNIVESPFLNYSPAVRIKPEEGTEILAAIREPYFSRTIEHYCSHANTPYTLSDADHPAVIRKNNVIFIAHDLDRQYHAQGARMHRELFYNALSLLRENPLVTTQLPSAGRLNLLHQPVQKRYVVHLLYASPHQRGAVSVIEDLVPLYNIPVTVSLEEKILRAYLVPSGENLRMKKNGKSIELVIPEFTLHTAVVLEYE
jgi:hypothetical protein